MIRTIDSQSDVDDPEVIKRVIELARGEVLDRLHAIGEDDPTIVRRVIGEKRRKEEYRRTHSQPPSVKSVYKGPVVLGGISSSGQGDQCERAVIHSYGP